MEEVKQERSGWRDMGLSLRHREWGFDAPCVDIDWLLIEYDTCVPIALMSYKLLGAVEESSANRKAFVRLADMARLPAFEVCYTAFLDGYKPEALNSFAKPKMPSLGWDSLSGWRDELEYVTWIYKLRGRIIPDNISNLIINREGG